ncbi:MAG: phytoene/squalene synthase family protein [Pseudomonadota bacterium]
MQQAPSTSDEAFQDYILQGVSRTFALTIPQLPEPLCRAVSNAYLLCRIADTIEDDAGFDFATKKAYSEAFVSIVKGSQPVGEFGAQIAPALAAHATPAERELLENTDKVIRITHSLNDHQREAMARCVATMAEGMVRYQGQETLDGVADQGAMDRYCYYVAGVVGEMLTALFCDHCDGLKARETEMMHLAVSFGQGLQMTNILKDIWDDRERGACWLPKDGFMQRGIHLSQVSPGTGGVEFEEELGHLIAIALGHVRNALRYTLIIPAKETGIRRFCLLALFMAVLTLRKLNSRRSFSSGQQVKISRNAVKTVVGATSISVRSDFLLNQIFRLTSRGLPQTEIQTPIASVAEIVATRALP